jgi:F0F1-type ATP synthase epsilon subunit
LAKNTFYAKIQTPREILFEGPVLALSSRNTDGKFDLLAQHANFISIIDNQPITIIKPDKTRQVFNFTQAIVYLVRDRTIVFGDPQTTAIDQ